MNQTKFIWHKGKIIKFDKACVHVLTPTSQFGANVFEGLRCYWSEVLNNLFIFRLDDHNLHAVKNGNETRYHLLFQGGRY